MKNKLIILIITTFILCNSLLTAFIQQQNKRYSSTVLVMLANYNDLDTMVEDLFNKTDEIKKIQGKEILNEYYIKDQILNKSYISYYLILNSGLTIIMYLIYQLYIKQLKQTQQSYIELEDSIENLMNGHSINHQHFPPLLSMKMNQLIDFINQKDTIIQTQKQNEKEYIENMTHQIKTPLTALKLFVELSKDPHQKQELIQINNIEEMINRVIKLSKLEAHAIKFEFEAIYLKKVIQDSIKALTPLIDETKHINLNCDSDLEIYGDELWLLEMFNNIIKNCLEYANHIEINVILLNHEIKIEIVDDGPGFNTKDLNYIFDRFYSKNHQRKNTGMGIGLAISKEVVQGHFGHIYAENNVLHGARFIIYLPIITGKEKI